MRVIMVSSYTGDQVGELELQPSNLRQLTVVEYLGTTYDVLNQRTSIERGLPVATLWVRKRGDRW